MSETTDRFEAFNDDERRAITNGLRANIAGIESGLIYSQFREGLTSEDRAARTSAAGEAESANRALLAEIER